LKKKGGPLCINSSKKILKISIINPTYPYVYECIVKIVYYSSEDGNKKFNHHHFFSLAKLMGSDSDLECFEKWDPK